MSETIKKLLSIRQNIDDLIKHIEDVHKTSEKHRKITPNGFDFDAVYDAYPRKMGRKRGMEILVRRIKTQDQYSSLLLASRNYREWCEKSQTEQQFIKLFSTWVNCWEDWITRPKTDREIMEEKQELQRQIRVSMERVKEKEIEKNIASNDFVKKEISNLLKTI